MKDRIIQPMRVHISEATKKCLKNTDFLTEQRGLVELKVWHKRYRVRIAHGACKVIFCGAFSLKWQVSMLIYWNKRKFFHKKRVELPQGCLGSPTWPHFIVVEHQHDRCPCFAGLFPRFITLPCLFLLVALSVPVSN